MFLIAGLGNPGKEYALTRHNAGFLMVDELRKQWGGNEFRLKSKLETLLSFVKLKDKSIILAKPVTYMNLSGQAIKKTADYYKIPASNIAVIYDDLDIEIGKYKITHHNAYQGGHKGVLSVVNRLSNKKIIRVKLGIERKGGRSQRGTIAGQDFVLQKFSLEEQRSLMQLAPSLASDLLREIN